MDGIKKLFTLIVNAVVDIAIICVNRNAQLVVIHVPKYVRKCGVGRQLAEKCDATSRAST